MKDSEFNHVQQLEFNQLLLLDISAIDVFSVTNDEDCYCFLFFIDISDRSIIADS